MGICLLALWGVLTGCGLSSSKHQASLLLRHTTDSSVAACIASLDFYISYLKLKGMESAVTDYQEAMTRMKETLIRYFYRGDLGGIQWAMKRDGTYYPYNVTNFILMPVWFGISLEGDVEEAAVKRTLSFIHPETGLLPMRLVMSKVFAVIRLLTSCMTLPNSACRKKMLFITH